MAAGSALSLPAWQLMLKRWFDVVFATVLLLLLSPLLLAVAVVIRLHSPGAALFLQYRCGLADRTFRMLKFRTMVVNQANVMDAAYVASLEGSGVLLKIKDDPRVTSVGKWLRRMSIDELPQLVKNYRSW
jgi:lipopolysaccharide/colanic/teichoic acid biosynthesis glycosyltransferase